MARLPDEAIAYTRPSSADRVILSADRAAARELPRHANVGVTDLTLIAFGIAVGAEEDAFPRS